MKGFFINLNTILQKEQKRQTGALVILMIVSAFLEVCGISTVLPIISALLDKDFMYSNAYAVMLCSMLGINTYNSFVITSVSILLVVFLLKNVLLILKSSYHAKFTLGFQYNLRKRVFHKYLTKDYSYYFNNNSAEIYKTLLEDITNVNSSFDGLLHILTDSIISFFLMIAVLLIDWRISLSMMAVIIVVSLVISQVIKPIIKKNGEISYNSARIRNKWILQSLQGIKSVKASETGSYFENKAYDTDIHFSNAEKNYRVLNTMPRMILELFSITSFVVLISLLVLQGCDFELMIPKIGAIGLACIKLLPGANSVISNIVSIRYKNPAVKRVAALMREPESIIKAEEFPDQYHDVIEASEISFKYSDNSGFILNNASIRIPVGTMIGIIGPSGEGKTTFVDILLGLILPESGSVSVDGYSIYQNIAKWRKSIGYITQNVFLLDDTIKTNIAFGIEDSDISDDKIWDALEKAQLADFVKKLPDGLESSIGENGIKLSGGQCQRLGIARALYNNPHILIFDEATSSLDAETESAVVESINNLYGEHTILIISHKSKALEKCDEIYRINNKEFEKVY